MKGKEALEKIGNMIIHRNEHEIYRIKHLATFNAIKAELDKLDRIKEVVKEVNYIGLYKNGCIKIKQIIEEETK